jgi:hypothetical protein
MTTLSGRISLRYSTNFPTPFPRGLSFAVWLQTYQSAGSSTISRTFTTAGASEKFICYLCVSESSD